MTGILTKGWLTMYILQSKNDMIHEHLPFSFLNIYITYLIDFLLLSAFANPPPQGHGETPPHTTLQLTPQTNTSLYYLLYTRIPSHPPLPSLSRQTIKITQLSRHTTTFFLFFFFFFSPFKLMKFIYFL